MRPSPLVLYVRQGCHLCDQFLVELLQDLGPAGERLAVVDVDSDTDLATRYGLRVPVLALDGTVLGEGRYDPAGLPASLRV